MKNKSLFFTLLIVAVLSVALIATLSVSAATATPHNESELDSETGRLNLWAGQRSAHPMNYDSVIASHFSIAADATFVGACCPSWGDSVGELRVELYAFDTDYDKTINGTPIADHLFVDYADNDYLGFTFDSADPLKAGEYVIRLSEASDPGGTGVGTWKLGEFAGQELYEGDEYIPDGSLQLGVKFVNTPEGDYFGKLTGYDDQEVEINTVPNMDNLLVFNSDEMLDIIEAGNGCQDFWIEEEGYLHIEVEATNDSQIKFILPKDADDSVYCDESTAVLIKFRRSEGTPLGGEIFFQTTLFPGPQPGGSVGASYEDTTDWQYAVFNFASNKNYTQEGAILDFLRFDIFMTENEEATFDIEYILFFDNKESALAWDKDIDALLGPAPTEDPNKTEAPATATPAPTEVPTQAPATEAPKATDAPAEEKEEGGCGSSVILAHAMLVIGAAMIIKKKK